VIYAAVPTALSSERYNDLCLPSGREVKSPPPTAITWVNSTVSDEAKMMNSNAEMLDSTQQQQQRQGIKRPAWTTAALPLLQLNDLFCREASNTPTRVGFRHFFIAETVGNVRMEYDLNYYS